MEFRERKSVRALPADGVRITFSKNGSVSTPLAAFMNRSYALCDSPFSSSDTAKIKCPKNCEKLKTFDENARLAYVNSCSIHTID